MMQQQTRKRNELGERLLSWKRGRLALDGSCEGEIVSVSEGWWCGAERAWMGVMVGKTGKGDGAGKLWRGEEKRMGEAWGKPGKLFRRVEVVGEAVEVPSATAHLSFDYLIYYCKSSISDSRYFICVSKVLIKYEELKER